MEVLQLLISGISQGCVYGLIALGFVLIYLLRGNLPWQGVKVADKKAKYEKIKKMKTEMTLEKLCEDLPEEFVIFMERVRDIEFEQKPNYDGLRSIFKDLFYKNGFEYDFQYDWIKKQRRDRLKGFAK